MARKPSDIVQPNLRIREDLRRQLEKAAKARDRGVSLNQEMTWRLQRSFEVDTAMSFDASAATLANLVERLDAREDTANMLGDLVRASEALLKQIDSGKPVEAAAAKVKSVINLIDASAVAALRKMHTTGEE